MSLDIALNLASSKSKSERWIKLYRKIHNLFIREELAHTKDVDLAVKQLDARITQVEANLNAAIAAVNTSLTSAINVIQAHTHSVTTVGGPTAQAGNAAISPATIPAPQPPKASAVKPVQYETKFMEAADMKLFLQGPASAPFMPRSTLEDTKASITAISDIGI